MSSLTNLEKRKFEALLGMRSGYVLNFNNRECSEIVSGSTGRDIFDSRYDYGSGSKANRLRKFWQIEDDAMVAKLMTEILDCGFPTGDRKSESDTVREWECRQIIARLMQGTQADAESNVPEKPQEQSPSQGPMAQTLAQLETEFYQLSAESDRSRAGLALEKLLNRLFAVFELEPRQPFRVVGEQIDGSFVLDGQVYLLESKWEKDALPEADLLVFRGKIEGKSTFTRGVFIALNDVSVQARHAITQGKAPSFFVMNGHDLLMILRQAMSLTEFLRRRVRLLGEEGRMCVPYSELT